MMKIEMPKVSERSLVTQAYLWLGVPVMQFLCFWFRAYIGIPVAILLVWAIWRILSKPAGLHAEGYTDVGAGRKNLLIFLLLCVVVILGGIGALVPQTPFDHKWRNAVFFDLVRNSWPVVYTDVPVHSVLCYYFGFWLPSAVVSKLTNSIFVGDLAQILYAAWGSWIALNFIFSRTGGKARWAVFLVFIFYNSFDLVTAYLFSCEAFSIFKNPWDQHLLWLSTTNVGFANSGNALIYNFIYNQGIPLWVMLTLFLHERPHTDRLLLLLGMLPIFSPIAAVAFIPYVAWRLLADIRRVVSPANVAGLLVALLSSAFLLQNSAAGGIRLVYEEDDIPKMLLAAVAYYTVSILPFLLFFFKEVKRDGFYWSLIAVAIPFTLFRVGLGCDLAWRISLPAILMTGLMMCRKSVGFKNMRKWAQVAFIAVMAISSFETFYLTAYIFHSQEQINRGERHRKYTDLYYHLHKDENIVKCNFVAENDSFYRRWLMPTVEGFEDESTRDVDASKE